MRRFARGLSLFLLLLFLGCRDNPPETQQLPQRNDVTAVQNLEHGYSALVAQFNADSAKVRILMMLTDTRVKHFWDGEAKLGHDYHQVLSLPANCRIAWDVYLLFRPRLTWREASPLLPTFWMHQLSCMSGELYLNTEVFRGEIERMLAESQMVQK